MEVEEVKQLTKTMERLYKVFHDDKFYHFETDNFYIDVKINTYLEEFIPNELGINHYNSRFRSVDKRSPLEEQFKDDVVTFRYYDTKEVELEGERYTTKKHNFSKKIYLGKRMTQEEIIEASKNNPRLISVINIMDIEESSSVIYCYNGIIITNFEEDAITLDELRKDYENIKLYKKH